MSSLRVGAAPFGLLLEIIWRPARPRIRDKLVDQGLGECAGASGRKAFGKAITMWRRSTIFDQSVPADALPRDITPIARSSARAAAKLTGQTLRSIGLECSDPSSKLGVGGKADARLVRLPDAKTAGQCDKTDHQEAKPKHIEV